MDECSYLGVWGSSPKIRLVEALPWVGPERHVALVFDVCALDRLKDEGVNYRTVELGRELEAAQSPVPFCFPLGVWACALSSADEAHSSHSRVAPTVLLPLDLRSQNRLRNVMSPTLQQPPVVASGARMHCGTA